MESVGRCIVVSLLSSRGIPGSSSSGLGEQAQRVPTVALGITDPLPIVQNHERSIAPGQVVADRQTAWPLPTVTVSIVSEAAIGRLRASASSCRFIVGSSSPA
jgi:hypothetical protein